MQPIYFQCITRMNSDCIRKMAEASSVFYQYLQDPEFWKKVRVILFSIYAFSESSDEWYGSWAIADGNKVQVA